MVAQSGETFVSNLFVSTSYNRLLTWMMPCSKRCNSINDKAGVNMYLLVVPQC